MPIISLVYVSFATSDLSDEELKNILEVARTKNKALDITGMLLYRDRFFIQVLEGEQKAVETLFAKIAQDPRHNNVLKIYSNVINERTFGDWTMGFNKMEAAQTEPVSGYNDFLSAPTEQAAFITAQPTRAVKLLETFKERTYF